jgi:hypothetical protein
MPTWDGSDGSVTADELAPPGPQQVAAAEQPRRHTTPAPANAAGGRRGSEHHPAGPAEAGPLMTEPPEADLRAAAERAWARLVAGETGAAFAAAWPHIRAELLKQRM